MDDYVKEAEEVIGGIKRYRFERGQYRGKTGLEMLTTSKVRNLLSMVNDIYNRTLGEEILTDDLIKDIQYLKVRMVYEQGRDDAVKLFFEKSSLIPRLDGISGSKEKFLEFSRYFEALVAYHRFFGGKD
jgi:CRISPR-associated protein Csm2